MRPVLKRLETVMRIFFSAVPHLCGKAVNEKNDRGHSVLFVAVCDNFRAVYQEFDGSDVKKSSAAKYKDRRA